MSRLVDAVAAQERRRVARVIVDDLLRIIGGLTVAAAAVGSVVSGAIVAGQWVRNRNRRVQP